jgi:predicted PP-loop superfamily ATPase
MFSMWFNLLRVANSIYRNRNEITDGLGETATKLKEHLREVLTRAGEGRCPECGGPHSQAWHNELVKTHQQRQAWKALVFILLLVGGLAFYCWWNSPSGPGWHAYHSVLEGK